MYPDSRDLVHDGKTRHINLRLRSVLSVVGAKLGGAARVERTKFLEEEGIQYLGIFA